MAVEPNPELVPVLQANVRNLGVEVRGVAVAGERGPVDFYPHEQSWHGSTALAHGPAVRVPAVALDDLIADDVELAPQPPEAPFTVFRAWARPAGVGATEGTG